MYAPARGLNACRALQTYSTSFTNPPTHYIFSGTTRGASSATLRMVHRPQRCAWRIALNAVHGASSGTLRNAHRPGRCARRIA